MKHLFLLAALLLPLLSPAQSPRLDPAFQPTQTYRHAGAYGALQLRDGSRVVLGSFEQGEGQEFREDYGSLVRYLPSGAPNVVFNAALANLGFSTVVMAEAANGKLLVYGGVPVGNRFPAELLRLNADGTRDATFTARPPAPPSGYGTILLVQADGKIIIGGALTTLLGQSPAPWLARLNADGSLDTSFQVALAGGAQATQPSALVQQADGKLLLAAYVTPAAGGAGQWQMLRLLPTGIQDPTFQVLSTAGQLAGVAVQPDGQVLVVVKGMTTQLMRLSAVGIPDATFAPASGAGSGVQLFSALPQIAVQADGRILVANDTPLQATSGQQPVARLLPSGAYDPAWNVVNAPGYNAPGAASVQLLPNGQVLLAADFYTNIVGGWEERGAALLTATGQRSPGFRPRLYRHGQVADVAQQPDGRLVAVGIFTEVNGVEVRGVARFELNGTLDTTFCRLARLGGGQATRVLALPNGQVVLSGNFTAVGGSPQNSVARLLPTGQPDATFVSALPGATPTARGATVLALAAQPDGKLLLSGSLGQGTSRVEFLRLQTSGARDAAFQTSVVNAPSAILVQPDGNIVLGGGSSGTSQPLTRLLPSGAPDPTFAAPALAFSGSGLLRVNSLAYYPDGRLLVGGRFTRVGGVTTTHVARLLPDGTPDATFATQTLSPSGGLSTLALQPNGRVLLGGLAQSPPPAGAPTLFRVLADGIPDPGFDSSRGPALGRREQGISRVLVQADGAIVAAGDFSAVSGLPVLGLTRLLDPNVLSASGSHRTAARLEVWPVPARGSLHLRLDAAARPRRVTLLDGLGRAVRTLDAPAAELVIATAGLAPGLYLLRVDYAGAAAATRRVVLE